MQKQLAAMALWLCASMAMADPLSDATVAYKTGDFANAVRLMHPLAETGEARAQFNLGLMYYNGQGGYCQLTEARAR